MNLFNKYSPTSLRAEHCSGKQAAVVNNQHYSSFITQTIYTLERGEKAYLYYKYQVEDIKKYFQDEVEITFNSKFNWWEAILTNCKASKRNKKGGNA